MEVNFHWSCLCFEACRFSRPYIRQKGNRRISKKFKVISKSLILLSRSQLSAAHDKRKSRTKGNGPVFKDLEHFVHRRWILPSCLSLRTTIYSRSRPPFIYINAASVCCCFNSIHNAYCGCKSAEAWNTWAFFFFLFTRVWAEERQSV